MRRRQRANPQESMPIWNREYWQRLLIPTIYRSPSQLYYCVLSVHALLRATQLGAGIFTVNGTNHGICF